MWKYYDEKGLAFKSATEQYNHVILYRKHVVPLKLLGEENMTRDSLRVVGPYAMMRLAPRAAHNVRLDLKTVYVVPYTTRVREVGDLLSGDLVKLMRYREEICDGEKERRLKDAEISGKKSSDR